MNAPPIIDYFSLDVEGHEYHVLEHFDFGLYTFMVMTVERPKMALHHLLVKHKYWVLRFMGNFGDTTYIHESIPNFRRLMLQYKDDKGIDFGMHYLHQPVFS